MISVPLIPSELAAHKTRDSPTVLRLPDELQAQLDNAVSPTELMTVQKRAAARHVGVSGYQGVARIEHR